MYILWDNVMKILFDCVQDICNADYRHYILNYDWLMSKPIIIIYKIYIAINKKVTITINLTFFQQTNI